ncbi:unnamed protein product [Brugia timori]|uniref:Uncharacterized protein n=1 Tax=Brugia timori TaxID=42155 RepID=A0A0R3Q6K7_9BILA|nr:unnamed protein product [Brugia timori]
MLFSGSRKEQPFKIRFQSLLRRPNSGGSISMPLFPLKFNTDKDTKLDNAAGTFDTKLLLTSRVVRAGNSICLLAAEHLCRLSRCFFFGDEMIFELGTRRGISVRRLLATRNVRNDSNLVCCL